MEKPIPDHRDRAAKVYAVIEKKVKGIPLDSIDESWVSFALGVLYRIECELASAAEKKGG